MLEIAFKGKTFDYGEKTSIMIVFPPAGVHNLGIYYDNLLVNNSHIKC